MAWNELKKIIIRVQSGLTDAFILFLMEKTRLR